MISSGRAPLSKGSVFLPYFSIAENLLCCLRLSYVVAKAPELVLYHHIDRADCVFPKPFLMWRVRGCPKGTISLVLISVSAIQEDIDSKYIHLQSQKVLPIYLCVQRKEANKFFISTQLEGYVWNPPATRSRLNFWLSCYGHEKWSPWGRDLSLPYLCGHLNCTELFQALR